VRDVQINQSSGQPSLDEAALKVGQIMKFSPAMNRDKVVPVWVSIPVSFQVR
jgi:TonB family protein